MSRLDVNARISLPLFVENVTRLATKQKDQVLKSRLETIALLMEHVENDKMWAAILKEKP